MRAFRCESGEPVPLWRGPCSSAPRGTGSGSPSAWAFDDGINVLGVLAIGHDGRRTETTVAESRYRMWTPTAEEPQPVVQEATRVRVLPFAFGVDKEIVGRE